jgi:predicted house-cleaning noncanonical NTP pyrophosphatase (MazG superfamily)
MLVAQADNRSHHGIAQHPTTAARTHADGVPSIIRSAGRAADVRALDTEDFGAALGDKLVEEVAELRAASDADAVVEEAADVLEVLLAIVAEHGATLDSIVDIARRKRVERGGFAMRVWLENADQAPTAP